MNKMTKKTMASFILLLIMIVSISGISFASSDNISNREVSPKEAETAALSFVQSLPEMPNKDLKAQSVLLLYDNSGNKTGFLVEIFNKKVLVASVVTSLTKNQYPILEANMGWSPVDVSKTYLKRKLEASDRILFTGPLSYYLSSNGNFVDLKSGKEILPDQIKVFKKSQTNTSSSVMSWKPSIVKVASLQHQVTLQSVLDDISGVRNYNSPAYNTCGPTAGAMVINYWYEQKGKAGLQNSSDIYTGSQLISSLSNYMNTGSFGTSVSNWVAGMTSYIRSKNYGLDSGAVELGNSWSGYTSEISNRRPLGVYIGQNYGALDYSYHWVTGVGWAVDDYGTSYLKINNAAMSGASTVYINYQDYSQYVLTFVKVIVNNRLY